jgi:ParB family transcriptional regulator, chromosome partitioning protein
MSYLQNNSIFWVEVDKVKPNPFQPRREFDEAKLRDLADSIKMYGLLQPLVVTRQEVEREDGGLSTTYELISGERRLRASKIAGLVQVPVIIRNSGEETDQVKLELAIIENLQREDLNPVERAQAFNQLAEQFGFTHSEIAKKVGKSREYVSNTIRLLILPQEILEALSSGKISEGHTRPILMLKDKPEEQITLFKEVVFKKLTVRESEAIARRIAYEKVRKQSRSFDPTLVEMEDKLAESLGTRVFIEKRPIGGKIMIDFFSNDDLDKILGLLQKEKIMLTNVNDLEKAFVSEESSGEDSVSGEDFLSTVAEIGDNSVSETEDSLEDVLEEEYVESPNTIRKIGFNDLKRVSVPSYTENDSNQKSKEDDDRLYSVSDFTI